MQQQTCPSFEEGLTQRNTSLPDKASEDLRCQQLEELLQRTIDFLVMLSTGDTITDDQIRDRDALYTQACQFLYPDAEQGGKEQHRFLLANASISSEK